MTPDPDTWPLAETWEECARHVEAGGVVEYLDYQGDDVWMQGGMTAVDYLEWTGTPGKRGWRPRRLMPIATPTPAGMTPGPEVDGRPTWYGTARDAEAAGMTEGRCWTKYKWIHVGVRDAAAIVQARYPLPKPKTERVYWWETVGRTDPNDGVIKWVTKVIGSEPRVYFAGCGWLEVSSPDGTVEVLAEDGES